MHAVPVIDIEPLRRRAAGELDVARAIDAACREAGFFCVVGHGVPLALADRLLHTAGEFFALPDDEKAQIAMERGGLAWRGWFPVGGELTSGIPDRKEGLYFGTDLAADDPRVTAGRPLHGRNLYPARPADLCDAVRDWLEAMTGLAHTIMRGVALGLGLERDWFETHLTADPTILFRIFHYPPGDETAWGVGEHTDYGLLTILLQDDCGGLEVKGPDGWVAVPPEPDVLVCNIGDMLDRMTGGRYRSTAHRVRNLSGRGRLSFPFFFDPSWDARVVPLPRPDATPADDAGTRWDSTSVHAWDGTYGEYLVAKVAKVFPALRDRVL